MRKAICSIWFVLASFALIPPGYANQPPSPGGVLAASGGLAALTRGEAAHLAEMQTATNRMRAIAVRVAICADGWRGKLASDLERIGQYQLAARVRESCFWGWGGNEH